MAESRGGLRIVTMSCESLRLRFHNLAGAIDRKEHFSSGIYLTAPVLLERALEDQSTHTTFHSNGQALLRKQHSALISNLKPGVGSP